MWFFIEKILRDKICLLLLYFIDYLTFRHAQNILYRSLKYKNLRRKVRNILATSREKSHISSYYLNIQIIQPQRIKPLNTEKKYW